MFIKTFMTNFIYESRQLFNPILSSFLLLYMILSLFLKFGVLHFALVLWVLLTILVSSIANGYAGFSLYDFKFFRTLLVIPPLLYGFYSIVILFIQNNKIYLHKRFLRSIFLILIFFSLVNAYFELNQLTNFKTPYFIENKIHMPHIFKDLFSIINKENLNNSSIKIGIFSENQEFMNIHDYLQKSS